jgi:hypothetical protein
MLGAVWIEITIAGFVYVIAIIFCLAAAYDVTDIHQLLGLKELFPYCSAALVAASYVTGIICHRISQILAPYILPRLVRFLRPTADRKGEIPTKTALEMAEIWQNGSSRIQREIDFQYALVALLRSLLISVPFLGVSVFAWMLRARKPGVAGLVAVDLALWVACYISYDRQWHQFRGVQDAALKAVRQVSKKKD